MERIWNHKPHVEISPSCPRCGSSNAKFCYYNNYSLTQPRYFCKGCRRYWTKGGSLRNVPVGGGCRKNRRGKSVRLTTNGGSSKCLAYVGGATSENVTNGNSCGYKVNAFVESSPSSTLTHQQDGSHIDLAIVYANFLNQQPETKADGSFEMPELPEFDPSVEFSSIGSTDLDKRVPVPEENNNNLLVGSLSYSDLSAAVEAHLRGNDHIYYSSVFDSVHDHKHNYQDGIQRCSSHHETSNLVLPPLPNEENASQEILWLNSQMMVNHNVQAATQEPMLGPEAQDPNNLLIGNWTPFDFSSDDTFNQT